MAVVGIRGGWSSERLADAIASRTGFREIVELDRVVADLEAGSLRHGELELTKLDGVVVKKVGREYGPHMLDRLDLLEWLAAGGVPVFSRPRAIARLVDRATGTLALRAGGVPMPPTVLTEDLAAAAQAVRDFGIAVLKPLYASKARGFRLIDAKQDDVEAEVRAYRQGGHRLLYVQKKIHLPGRDLGCAFLGGRHIGTYARVAGTQSWNTTVRAGGHYEAHEPSPEVLAVAERAQAIFGLEFTGVDVAEGEDGPVVFEVSAFGGFRGLEEGAGVDAAAKVAEHVLARVRAERR